jgi:transcriptional antiterminator RfaH
MTQWFAVYARPQKESLASEHLARQGFEVFCPRYLKRRSHARRVDMVPAPLFPRYLFVRFDPQNTQWQAIRSTRGVIGLVSNGNDLVRVPDLVIDEIRTREDADGYVVLANQLKMARGAKIRIEEGPLSSCDAIFEAQKDGDRVIALLSLFGRKVVTHLPMRSVAPADS